MKGYSIGLFSFGNKKVPCSTVIFNMTPAAECPSRHLGFCQHPSICYAQKAERLYPQALPFRYRQMHYWRATNAKEFADMLSAVIMIASNKMKVDSFRFSEAGDFEVQADVDKMAAVASIMKGKGITVYGYTARKDLNLKPLMRHAIVNGSEFMASNNFTVVDKPSGKRPLCAGNCSICKLCRQADKLTIEVRKH